MLPAADPRDLFTSYECPCSYCQDHGDGVLRDKGLLCRHNLWTVMATVERVRGLLDDGTLPAHLEQVVRVHQEWFPDSLLGASLSADEQQE